MIDEVTMPLITLAKQKFIALPEIFITAIDHENQRYWVKKRPFSKKTRWHRLQHVLTYVVPLPVLYPTVTEGGSASLKWEAERLRLFAAQGIPVPVVIAETSEFIITTDTGEQLHAYVASINDVDEKKRLLISAAKALSNLHKSGLCHGRPSLRDMTYKNGEIYFIDLEENPLAVMTLAQAQARDIWLFLNNIARHAPRGDLTLLRSVYTVLEETMSPDTQRALKQMVRTIKPVRFMAEHLVVAIAGRDVRCAVAANKMLEMQF